MTDPKYGTAKRTEYDQLLQDRAKDLFNCIDALIPGRARQEEGSYSIDILNITENLQVGAKIVIYETGVGKGKWQPGTDGVYVLLRTRGNPNTHDYTVALMQPTDEDRRFAYFRLEDSQDLQQMAQFIVANCDY